MRHLLIFVLLAVNVMTVKAQVSGIVSDSVTAEPLAGIKISSNQNQSVLTDSAGRFMLPMMVAGSITISGLGYMPQVYEFRGDTVHIRMQRKTDKLDDVVVVGSRWRGRGKAETAVPVDVIDLRHIATNSARSDLSALLNYASPSFNYNKQSGCDGADFVDIAALRGMSPDATLVLINGKRRHPSSFVAIYGTLGRAASGTDLSSIPVSAIEKVEILRDGASAQYGSDAIAGVINIILRKDTAGPGGSLAYSGFFDTRYNTWRQRHNGEYPYSGPIDGNAIQGNLNYGIPLGTRGGHLHLSAQWLAKNKTYRQQIATDSLAPDHLPLNIYRRANGDGSLRAVSGAFDVVLPLGKEGATRLYAFGTYSQKSGSAYAYTRRWQENPDRFPTDDRGQIIYDADIMYLVPGDTVYDPEIHSTLRDVSLSMGCSGKNGRMNWDISNTTGYNQYNYFARNTFNPGLGASRTRFSNGGFSLLQNTFHLNATRHFPLLAAGLNLAAGLEHRYEAYSIKAGEQASYASYHPDKASGAQGFPGFQPADAVHASRSVAAAYIDAEWDISQKWMINSALRLEHYSDFGGTSNYKLAGRYALHPKLMLRASGSTGFRAPTLAQIYFSNTFTNVIGGAVFETRIARNNSELARAAGIQQLRQERSLNGSLGWTYKPSASLLVTLDYYQVHLKNKVVLSGNFSADDASLPLSLTQTLKGAGISSAQFFANAVNTRNQGLDMIADYLIFSTVRRSLRLMFAGNWQQTRITDVRIPDALNSTDALRATFLSERERQFITAAAPRTKFSLNAEFTLADWSLGARCTYFGKLMLLGFGDQSSPFYPVVPTEADPAISVPDELRYSGKLVTDLYLQHRFSRHWKLLIGVDNLFNIHPDLSYVKAARNWAYNNESAGPFDAVQMGMNGRNIWARLQFQL
jgi:iron complex outermembrane receptor protein